MMWTRRIAALALTLACAAALPACDYGETEAVIEEREEELPEVEYGEGEVPREVQPVPAQPTPEPSAMDTL